MLNRYSLPNLPLLAWLSTHLPVPLSSKATPTSFPVPLPSAIAQIQALSPSIVVSAAISVVERSLVAVVLLAAALADGEERRLLFVFKLICMLLTDAVDDDAELILFRTGSNEFVV